MLDLKAVQELKRLMKEEYGKDYTDEEAQKAGESLILLFKTLLEAERKHKSN
ncbi:MAG: hypothetical protein Q8N84_02490 [bacterium]|nr:hypothetical protein [bacterium]